MSAPAEHRSLPPHASWLGSSQITEWEAFGGEAPGLERKATVLKAPSQASAGHAEVLGFGVFCSILCSMHGGQAWHSSLRRYRVFRHGCDPWRCPYVSQNLFHKGTCPSEARGQKQGSLSGHCVTHAVSASGISVSAQLPPSADQLRQQRMMAEVSLFPHVTDTSGVPYPSSSGAKVHLSPSSALLAQLLMWKKPG